MGIQRVLLTATCSVNGAGAGVDGAAVRVPLGGFLGGVQYVVAKQATGGYGAGSVALKLQGTNQALNNDPSSPTPATGAQWTDIPTTSTGARFTADGSVFVGDGSYVVDLTPYAFVRLVPTVVAGPTLIDCTAYLKYDCEKG